MSLETALVALAQAVGADIKNLNTNKVDKVSGKGLFTLTKEYISAETSIASGGAATLTHGLGATPKSIHLSVICKTAELGYTVGEEALLAGNIMTSIDAGIHLGVQTASNGTTIRLKVGTQGIGIMNMTSGIPVLLTPASWRIIVRAYA